MVDVAELRVPGELSDEELAAEVARKTPAVRVFCGTRTDDGMDYARALDRWESLGGYDQEGLWELLHPGEIGITLTDGMMMGPEGIREYIRCYYGQVSYIDDFVGRILDRLDELGLAENTLFIFYSDNGGNIHCGLEETDASGEKYITAITSNHPLRGGKGGIHEGGVRVPLIVKYPPLCKAGSICSEPTITYDFYPTVVDLAGGDPDVGRAARARLAPEHRLGHVEHQLGHRDHVLGASAGGKQRLVAVAQRQIHHLYRVGGRRAVLVVIHLGHANLCMIAHYPCLLFI